MVARDSGHEVNSKCNLTVTVPKSYKKPKFLESLRAVLTEEGAVNLECKVIGVPQPTLSWFKDGVELKQGNKFRYLLSFLISNSQHYHTSSRNQNCLSE